jgi:hypothetical protein
MKKQTVLSPKHLQQCLDALFVAEFENTVDNTHRCYYWLAFAGATAEEALSVRNSDVDIIRSSVRLESGKELVIYKEGKAALKLCLTQTQFEIHSPIYHKISYRDRVPSDKILRGVKGMPSPTSMRTLLASRTRLVDNKDSVAANLSYIKIWLSGIFYRTYERELIGIKPDFMPLANELVAGRQYDLSSGRNTLQAKRRQLAREYLKDYERWKLAHSL